MSNLERGSQELRKLAAMKDCAPHKSERITRQQRWPAELRASLAQLNRSCSGRKNLAAGPAPGLVPVFGRRSFIKKLALATTLAAAAPLCPFLIRPASAFYIPDLPPGIQLLNNVDDELMCAFGEMYFDTRLERVMKILEYKCKKETPLIQPVYWLTAEIYRLKPEGEGVHGYLHKQLKLIKGTNMENWFKGIHSYYRAWINEKYACKNNDYLKTEEHAKEYFAKTFTRACTENTLGKKGEENYKEFIKKVENQNYDSFIVSLNNNLKKQDYNQRLLASWALFLLSLNYAQRTRSETKNFSFIRHEIEPVVWKFIPRVAGPPSYRNIL